MTTATKVTVLTGGSTHERDVALAGAAQVVAALRALGHDVRAYDTATGPLDSEAESRLLVPRVGRDPPETDSLTELAARERDVRLREDPAILAADVVFLVLHGPQGEGGGIQALLDGVGVPYTGSGPLGSMLAMDKDVAKRLMRDAAVPTPGWAMWPAAPEDVARLGMPVVVKPSKAGSSVGLSVVRDPEALPAAVAAASEIDDEVLLESFLPGRELTVGMLDGDALAVGEIIPSHDIFDYECKYTPGLTREIFPPDIPDTLANELRRLAAQTHAMLKLRDFSRVDFRLDEAGQPFCLEVNTLPGLTATSLLPQSAAAAGIPFPELCGRLVTMALRRGGSRNKVRDSGEL